MEDARCLVRSIPRASLPSSRSASPAGSRSSAGWRTPSPTTCCGVVPHPGADTEITLEALQAVPYDLVFTGSLLGNAVIPLWLLGLWPVYVALAPAGRWLSLPPVFILGYALRALPRLPRCLRVLRGGLSSAGLRRAGGAAGRLRAGGEATRLPRCTYAHDLRGSNRRDWSGSSWPRRSFERATRGGWPPPRQSWSR